VALCKLCKKDRRLVLYSPYYGLHSDKVSKTKHKVKICNACAITLKNYATKRFTDVLQADVWDKKVTANAIEAVLRPLRRINYMVRFGGEITANPESLAEHSYFVLLFATQIAKCMVKGTVDFERLVSIAMFHDTNEIILGDIPTPLKTGRVRKENGTLEKEVQSMFDKMGLWTGGLDTYDYSVLSDTESRIVKCADYLSAIVYCVEEIYIGSNNLSDPLTLTVANFSRFVHHEWEKELLGIAISHIANTVGSNHDA
jgi:5'-deoxynucleotidase